MLKRILLMSILTLCVTALLTPALAQDDKPVEHSPTSQKAGGVKGLEKRIKHLEEMVRRQKEGRNWYDRVNLSGLVEVEAGYNKTDYKDPAIEDEKGSDLDLANVELVFDANIVNHPKGQVNGHVMLKYSDDDVYIDEGYILLSGTRQLPFYLIAGRQYVPFGHFDSHFISDPQTLVLGETNEGALVAGYRLNGSDVLDISAGAFNGKAREAGDDDTIDSLVASIKANPLPDLSLGVSYISNLASADAFNEAVVDSDNLDSIVSGWSAYVSYTFLDRWHLIAEYVGALDEFKAGELYDAADGKQRKPSAWNLELGFSLTDTLEIAARYGGSDDGADFMPESEYGAVVNWTIIENTNLGLEYLHGEFEDDVQKTDSFTAQLAIQF